MVYRVRENLQLDATLIADGYFIDSQGLPRLYRASTLTQYVDNVLGNDGYTGDVGAPLATIAEAIKRIPSPYTDVYDIQLVGAGPYTDPGGGWPIKGIGGGINILGDRSTLVDSDASPTFTNVAGKEAQFEDSSFGSMVATFEGVHWTLIDFTPFAIAGFKWSGSTNVTNASGVTVVTNLSGLPHFVYEYVTEVIFPLDASAPEFSEPAYIGCRIDEQTAFNFRTNNYNLTVCRPETAGSPFITNGSFSGPALDGYMSGLGVTGAGSATIGGVFRGPKRIFASGNASIRNAVVENRIQIGPGSLNIEFIDFEDGPGIMYEHGVTCKVRECTTDGTSGFIQPAPASFGRGVDQCHFVIDSDPWTPGSTVTGDAIELINGSSVDGVSNLNGNMTATGDELVMDGVGHSFSEAPLVELGDLTRASS